MTTVTKSEKPVLDLAPFKILRTSKKPFVAAIPGSKSYTNRALILASQRIGRTELVGALHCEDTDLLAACLNSFGGLSAVKTSDGFVVERTSEVLQAPAEPVYVGGGGTPARLLIAFAVSAEGDTIIDGNARLRERPMGDLLTALTGMGVRYTCLGQPGCLPVKISGGRIGTTKWSVSGAKSSQFLTSLLLAAAQQDRPITIEVEGDLVSKSYVEMTLYMMRQVGLQVETFELKKFVVQPGVPVSDRINVEVDASAMSYFLGAAALTGTTVLIPGIAQASKQGDAGLATLMEEMGCTVLWRPEGLQLTGRPLTGLVADMDTMPDTVLTLAVVASQATSATRVTGIANLKIKECDRIHAIAAELNRLGVPAVGADDFVEVTPSRRIVSATVSTYNDHRVAMAFSLLGLIHDGVRIEDPACVEKSFPSFWRELSRFVNHHNAAVMSVETSEVPA